MAKRPNVLIFLPDGIQDEESEIRGGPRVFSFSVLLQESRGSYEPLR